MLTTERMPEHQYHQEQRQNTTQAPVKKVILVNKLTHHSYYCDSKPLKIDEKNRLCFSELINDLKPQFPDLHRAFFFLCINNKEYLVGADPFTSPRYIDYGIFEDNEIIILYNEQKHHKKKEQDSSPDGVQTPEQQQLQQIQNIQNMAEEQQLSEFCSQMVKIEDEKQEFQKVAPSSNIEEKIQKEIQKYVKPREKRVKERTIEYVIEKVKKWREIYEQGIKNELGEDIRPNLDVAAYLVQLSRKTLDDYYAQLRKGEMYGFDFAAHKHEKMGMLRKYVKEQQKSNPIKKNKGKLEEIEFLQEAQMKLEEEDNTKQQEQLQQQQIQVPQSIKQLQQSLQQHQNLQNFQQNQQILPAAQHNQGQSTPKPTPQPTNTSQKIQEKMEIEEPQEQEMQLKRLPSRVDEYERIMRQEYMYQNMNLQFQVSPVKPHKGSTDVCDLFMNFDEPKPEFELE